MYQNENPVGFGINQKPAFVGAQAEDSRAFLYLTPARWLLKQRAVSLLGASSCVSLLGARPRFAGPIP
jgi:hypothetical protein